MTDINLTPEIFGDYGLHLENMKRTRAMRNTWKITDGKETLEANDCMEAISQALKLARKPENIRESVIVRDDLGNFYNWIREANCLFNTSEGM